MNFAAAVLIRQQHVLNASSPWPAAARHVAAAAALEISKVHHVGGLHVGAALAGTGWLCAFDRGRDRRPRAPARDRLPRRSRCPTASFAALTLIVVVCAAPVGTHRAHNVFE